VIRPASTANRPSSVARSGQNARTTSYGWSSASRSASGPGAGSASGPAPAPAPATRRRSTPAGNASSTKPAGAATSSTRPPAEMPSFRGTGVPESPAGVPTRPTLSGSPDTGYDPATM